MAVSRAPSARQCSQLCDSHLRFPRTACLPDRARNGPLQPLPGDATRYLV